MSPGPDSPLDAYAEKRDFAATPEPEAGEVGGHGAAAEGLRFVVHEHHARRLHWDLRLERDGVLVSWAVPNGIPQDPRQNRKAVHVEDHPLSYIDFSGTIPVGQYGAGSVGIWDAGTYAVEKWEQAKVVVRFSGSRLQGRYALFRAGADERDWMIHRMDPPEDPRAGAIPDWLDPVPALAGPLPAGDDPEWVYELAWDGLSVIVHSEPGRIALLHRASAETDPEDVTARFGELRPLNRSLSSHSAILVGDIVALGASGRPDPEVLARRVTAEAGAAALRRLAVEHPVTLVLTDLLWLDGHSLVPLGFGERRERLEALGLDTAPEAAGRWHTSPLHRGDGGALLAAARRLGLSGLVARRLDAPARSGVRGAVRIRA